MQASIPKNPVIAGRLVLAALLWLYAGLAGAEPWAAPGDLTLRHDLQLLADAGVIRGPVHTWPLSWGNIARDVLATESLAALGPAQRAALARVRHRAQIEMASGEYEARLRLALAEEPRTVRSFEDTAREPGELEAGVRWTGLRFSYKLQLGVALDASDNREFRADGSYAGVALGNWMISAGAVDRWWGPGYEGSLILGSNARPVPALSVNRNYSDPFTLPWLRWIGPWSLDVIFGVLDGNRSVPDTQIFAMRVGFRPVPQLEIGLSRSAQWCGEGRPCGFDTFVDLLAGRDNRGVDLDISDEPGNQLAGLDARWAFTGRGWPLAIHGQMIGEDEAGGLPSRYIGLVGLEHWGYLAGKDASYRVHLEYADTTAEFYNSEPRYDYAYEHEIYLDGYRFRNRSLGHGLDNDARMVSLGAVVVDGQGYQWTALAQVAELNRGGAGLLNRRNTLADEPTDLVNIEIGHARPFGPGWLEVSLGYERLEAGSGTSATNDLRMLAQWRWDL